MNDNPADEVLTGEELMVSRDLARAVLTVIAAGFFGVAAVAATAHLSKNSVRFQCKDAFFTRADIKACVDRVNAGGQINPPATQERAKP